MILSDSERLIFLPITYQVSDAKRWFVPIK